MIALGMFAVAVQSTASCAGLFARLLIRKRASATGDAEMCGAVRAMTLWRLRPGGHSYMVRAQLHQVCSAAVHRGCTAKGQNSRIYTSPSLIVPPTPLPLFQNMFSRLTLAAYAYLLAVATLASAEQEKRQGISPMAIQAK